MNNNLDNFGTVEADGQVYTYEILSPVQKTEIDKELFKYGSLPRNSLNQSKTIKLQGLDVAVYGKEHNNLPLEIRELISKNHILPEILEKQIKFLYGQGPYLYREEVKYGEKTRTVLTDLEIQDWLDSWKTKGLEDDYRVYLMKVIRDYYYTEGIFSKWELNLSSRIHGKIPVRGLEHVSVNEARLATKKEIRSWERLKNKDFDKVVVGDWLATKETEFDIHHRFDESNPLKNAQAINYTCNASFAESLYSFPTYYYGLRDWIKGSNVNPKYINSFLKNSLSAKLHVIIPHIWIKMHEADLQKVCETNRILKENGKEQVLEYQGVKIGTEYRQSMIENLIKNKLRQITKLMSGEGENQGKIFSSISFKSENGIDGWEFKEIPLKYKEYIESIIKYDERAVQVILEGKGLDPSISNVSKEGIISKSGADVYYNYLIYLQTLDIPELFCTYDINKAISINFPHKKGIKLGFYHNVPKRQEEVSPKDRISEIN